MEEYRQNLPKKVPKRVENDTLEVLVHDLSHTAFRKKLPDIAYMRGRGHFFVPPLFAQVHQVPRICGVALTWCRQFWVLISKGRSPRIAYTNQKLHLMLRGGCWQAPSATYMQRGCVGGALATFGGVGTTAYMQGRVLMGSKADCHHRSTTHALGLAEASRICGVAASTATFVLRIATYMQGRGRQALKTQGSRTIGLMSLRWKSDKKCCDP